MLHDGRCHHQVAVGTPIPADVLEDSSTKCTTIGLQAGDVWRLRTSTSRDEGGLEDISWEGKGSPGGWRVARAASSGRGSCVSGEVTWTGRLAKPVAAQAGENGELKLANPPFSQMGTLRLGDGQRHRAAAKGTGAAQV